LQKCVDYEMGKVIDNISDLDTDDKKAREITIKLKIHPTMSRDAGSMTFDVKSKLAPRLSADTTLSFSKGKAFENTGKEAKKIHAQAVEGQKDLSLVQEEEAS